jgi:ketosteroid isomerase-like protein
MDQPTGTRPTRRTLLTTAVGTTAALGLSAGTAYAATPVRPRVTATILGREVDVTQATPEVVRLFASYFEAKTARNVDATMAHFAPDMTYIDATLGWAWYRWQELYDLFAQLMPTWPRTAASYPTRIIGDTTSALVCFTDTPELFGHEIRPLGAVNFRNGKITRWIDYWDGREFTAAGIEQERTPAAQFPTDFKEEAVGETASPVLRATLRRLNDALSAGDTEQALALFHPDAVFEDQALHISVVGRVSLKPFLDAALPLLPYGRGAKVRHVVGSRSGGGYEWTNASNAAPRGITALVLDDAGLITRLTTVWDSSLWSVDMIGAAQAASILR